MAHPTPVPAGRRLLRGLDRLALASATFLAVAAAGACVYTGSSWTVASQLDHEREISFVTYDLSPSVELVLDVGAGDVEVIGTDGPARVTATVHEEHPGTADVYFEGGRLVVATADGDEAMIGDLRVEVPHAVQSLRVNIGAGSVEIDGLAVRDGVAIAGGVGDVTLDGLGALRQVEVSLGVGEVSLSDIEAELIVLDIGTGDVTVEDLWAGVLEVDSGIGSLTVRTSQIDHVEADTGIGDIELISSQVGSHDFDAGIGSLRFDD